MDLLTLKNQIMKNEIQHFYVFTGTELGIQKIYLNQMSKVLNIPITVSYSVNEVLSKCNSNSLFGSQCGFYTVRGDEDFIKHEELHDRVNLRNSFLVVLYEKLDEGLKFTKHFKNSIIEFNALTENVLISYITREGLSSKSAKELSSKVSCSYDLAFLEIDKIKNYAQHEHIPLDRSFEILVDNGLISGDEESDVFQFVNAVMKREGKTAVKIFEQLKSKGTQNINILGMLYNTMKTVLLVQCCENSDICNVTGLNNGQVYHAKKHINIYNDYELVSALKLICETTQNIKNGKIDDNVSLLYVVTQII